MSLPSAFEIGLIRPVIQGIADVLAGGISVNVIPETREPFVNLPGLRGYWPMSAVDFLGNAKDHSGASSDLARSGAPQFGYDGNAFIQCGVGNDILQGSTSAQDVSGTETWINPAIRGLTWGGWVKVDTTPLVFGGVVSIWPSPTQQSYTLNWRSDNTVYATVSSDGTAATFVQSPAQSIAEWMFIVGRFTPSTELAIFTNATKTVVTASVPASLHNSTGVFTVGGMLGLSTRVLEAKFRDVFVCAVILTDSQIENLRLSSAPAT